MTTCLGAAAVAGVISLALGLLVQSVTIYFLGQGITQQVERLRVVFVVDALFNFIIHSFNFIN